MAQFIRQHEKALANSLQLTVQRRKPQNSSPTTVPPPSTGTTNHSSTSTIAAALSFAGINFKSSSVKSAQMTLTPHHLFYLLSRFEELGVNIGPMTVRMESIHSDTSPTNYISFLQARNPQKARGDTDSIHSVSSIRSVMSGMSQLWSNIGLSMSSSKSEKARLALENDLKYIYGAFTKLPALRLAPDHRASLIKGYEQFPFDTAVPLFAFKNLQQLEMIDLDFRSFHGWDRLADQLCFLVVKRGNVDDPLDLLENIVLDDADKRRRRSNRGQAAPSTPSWSVPSTPQEEYARSHSDPGSPQHISPGTSPRIKARGEDATPQATPTRLKTRSHTFVEGSSPKRPTPIRPSSAYRHARSYSSRVNRSGSASSHSSDALATPGRNDGNTNSHTLPTVKWQRLVYLALTDNGLTALPARSLQPVATTLKYLSLASNLFTEIPDSIAKLTRLVSLDLSNCMIDTLQTLTTCPLPAITTLKLRSNRLQSLAGIERLPSLENLHVQDNKLSDPDEVARLTQSPNFKRLFVKHNPLTKKYPDYRVRILNHFRRVPGYSEDIILDDQPATYSERKNLIERAKEAEPISIPIIKPSEPKVVVVQDTLSSGPVLEASQRLSSVTMQRQESAASNTRKKSMRKRVIEFSDNDPTPVQDTKLPSGRKEDSATPTKVPAIRQILSDKSTPLANSLSEPNLTVHHISERPTIDILPQTDGDDYRRNVEELRLKLGNTWLSALGEQHNQWQSDTHVPTLASTHPIPPQIHQYHTTQAIVGVGGSLL